MCGIETCGVRSKILNVYRNAKWCHDNTSAINSKEELKSQNIIFDTRIPFNESKDGIV